MSSLKNALKSQRTHRERHQPEARNSHGLLEKKKDYRQRARDFNAKKDTLKRLKKKALNKNPDEFYHRMVNSRLEDGVHREAQKEEVLTPFQVKLMQTQDLKYVVHRRTIERKKIEKLRSELHLLDADDRCPNTHTFFVDSESEVANFQPAERLATHPALLARSYNRPRLSALKEKADGLDGETLEEIQKQQVNAYKELQKRIERERQLGIVQQKMDAKKNLQNPKDQPIAVVKEETKDSAPVLRWAKERKR